MDLELKDFYTSIEEAGAELARRQCDPKLMSTVKNFLEPFGVPFASEIPRAILNRPIISPNQEFYRFLQLTKSIEVKPIFLEYNSKFVSKNKCHYYLCKPYIFQGLDKNKVPRFQTTRIVDFNESEGLPFREVKTIWGEHLMEYHHRLLYENNPEISSILFDFTDWFNRTRNLTTYYYLNFLSLFICHGILFDNFIIQDKEERRFFFEKVLPSFKKVTELFGVKPLIVPLVPLESEGAHTWLSYDIEMSEKIKVPVIMKSNALAQKIFV